MYWDAIGGALGGYWEYVVILLLDILTPEPAILASEYVYLHDNSAPSPFRHLLGPTFPVTHSLAPGVWCGDSD